MKKTPQELFDAEAGRVVAHVVCPECGSKVVGIVQERWTTETPTGELLEALEFRRYFGKAGRNEDGVRGVVVAMSPIMPGAPAKVAFCPRHGRLVVDLSSVTRDADNVVLAAEAQRGV